MTIRGMMARHGHDTSGMAEHPTFKEDHMADQTRASDTPQTYYSRPVEAMRLDAGNLVEGSRWCGGRVQSEDRPNGGSYVLVPHLDGPFQAHPNRWLVRTSSGAFAVMTDTDFHDAYQVNPPRPQGPLTRDYGPTSPGTR